MQDLTPSLADAFGLSGKKGAVVSRVIPDSAAQQAGIREGDVIVRFNDKPVYDSADLRNAVGLLRTGAGATVQFYRDGKLKTVKTQIKDSGGVCLAQSRLAQSKNYRAPRRCALPNRHTRPEPQRRR